MEEINEKKEINQIKEALTCFICSAKVLDPVMCTKKKCNKLFCSKCIKKWLKDNNNQCPNCKNDTSFEQMISLPFMNHMSTFFIKEIDNNKKNQKQNKKEHNIFNENNKDNNLSRTQILSNDYNLFDINDDIDMKEKEDEKKVEYCPKHKYELIEYYCLNCNTNHCPKCLTILSEESQNHIGHKIISIEQRNKYNLQTIKSEINNLSSVVEELLKYKNNLEQGTRIMNKKEEFIKTLMSKLREKFIRCNDNKKYKLEMKKKLLEEQIKNIYKLRNDYVNTINDIIKKENQNELEKYKQKIMDFKDSDKYEYYLNLNYFLKPNLNVYETDYVEIDTDIYNETIGETDFVINEIDKKFHFKLGGEAINEVGISLLIELDGKENQLYNAFIFIKKINDNNNNILYVNLDEEMNHDKYLILGKTIIKSSLSSVINEQNKLYIKLILSHIDII